MSTYLLTKVKGSTPLRTESVIGVSGAPPTVGEPFVLVAPPITAGAFGRLVTTSRVVELTDCGFKTESGSEYRIEAAARA